MLVLPNFIAVDSNRKMPFQSIYNRKYKRNFITVDSNRKIQFLKKFRDEEDELQLEKNMST